MYRVDPSRASAFCKAIKTYFPSLEEDNLVPSYAGVRPKLHGPAESSADFLVTALTMEGRSIDLRSHSHATAAPFKGIVHLFGIESPGLTSSLALANLVSNFVVKK